MCFDAIFDGFKKLWFLKNREKHKIAAEQSARLTESLDHLLEDL